MDQKNHIIMGDKLKNRKWYAFLGGSPLDTNNYQVTGKTPSCNNGRNLCAIYARGFGEQPEELSQSMRLAIANGLVTNQRQLTEAGFPIVLMK